MNVQELVRNYNLLFKMGVDRSSLLNDIILATFYEKTLPKDILSEEEIVNFVSEGKVESLYFEQFLTEEAYPADIEDHIMTLSKYQNLADHVSLRVVNVFVVDKKHIVLPITVSYAYEEDDMYGVSGNGKCYVMGNSHDCIYVNGTLINQSDIESETRFVSKLLKACSVNDLNKSNHMDMKKDFT